MVHVGQIQIIKDGIGTTSYGYDSMGRLTSVNGPWANDTITYSYDALGRRSEINLDVNVTYYDYDSLSRLTSVTHGADTFNYAYNGASDQLNHVTLPNGTKSTFSYDCLGRMTNVQDTVTSGGANISQFTYGYDNRDVQTSVQRALGTASAQTVNYTYDNIGQLTGETSNETTPLVNNSYTYDDAGNRLTSSTNGTQSTFTLDEMNQISGYTLGGNAVNADYDDNGNTTQLGFQTMSYDDADRLTSVVLKNPLTGDNVKKTEYEYDSLSRRSISKTYTWDAGTSSWDQQDERHFIYDGMDLIEERDGSNNVIASYVRDGNIGGALSRTTSSGTFYYHYDGNGNVVAMTNTSGAIVVEYTYDAYGNITSMSGSQAADNPIRFSTKYFDQNTGYYDFGFRSYDPVTGRWLSRDPVGEEGGLNLYGFVGNSPNNEVDGYGLDPKGPAFPWSKSGVGINIHYRANQVYYGSIWVNKQMIQWRHEGRLDILKNHNAGKFDYKLSYGIKHSDRYAFFWVNGKWLRPAEFGNYAIGYATYMVMGSVGVGIAHTYGALIEKWNQLYSHDSRPDGFQNRPWWDLRDGSIDYGLATSGAKDAGIWEQKHRKCPTSYYPQKK